jgi:superoxide reductase
MTSISSLFQIADWKAEKHVPVIECADTVKRGETFPVTVTIGKGIAHPNTTAHHIRWIDVYFQPVDGKFPFQIGKVTFTAHGESTEGADTSTVYTHHAAVLSFKTEKPGTIFASSYCNIHGLWQNSKQISVES